MMSLDHIVLNYDTLMETEVTSHKIQTPVIFYDACIRPILALFWHIIEYMVA